MVLNQISERSELDHHFSLITLVVLVSIILTVLYVTLVVTNPILVTSSDYIAYLTGGLMVRKGAGEAIYDLESQFAHQLEAIKPYERTGVLPFRYPPFVAIPFLPFSILPVVIGYRLFAGLNFLALGLFAWLSAKIFGKLNSFRFWYLLPLVYFPAVFTILLGQTSIILLIVFLFLYYYLEKKKSLLAGMLSPLLLFKPQYIVSFPFFFLLARNRGRFLAGFLLTLFALTAISIYTSGTEELLGYPSFLFLSERTTLGSQTHHMFTLQAFLSALPLISTLSYRVLLAVNGALYLLVLYLFWRKQKQISFEQSFIASSLLFPLFAIHVLGHDLSLLLVPIFIFLSAAARQKTSHKNPFLILALTLFLLPVVILTGSAFAAAPVFLAIALFLLKTRPKFLTLK